MMTMLIACRMITCLFARRKLASKGLTYQRICVPSKQNNKMSHTRIIKRKKMPFLNMFEQEIRDRCL